MLVPLAACGASGSAGRPSALSSSTVPANGSFLAASTELTSSSGVDRRQLLGRAGPGRDREQAQADAAGHGDGGRDADVR